MAVSHDQTSRLWTVQDEKRFFSVVLEAKERALRTGISSIACSELRWQSDFDWLQTFEQNPLDATLQVFWRNGEEARRTLAIAVRGPDEGRESQSMTDIRVFWEQTTERLVGDAQDQAQFFCALTFDDSAVRDEVWKKWPRTLFELPRYLFKEDEFGVRLVIAIEVTEDGEVDDVVQMVTNELSQLTERRVERYIHKKKLTVSEASSAVQAQCVSATDKAHWQRAVAQVAEKIGQGEFAKVVMARRSVVRESSRLSMKMILQNLQEHYETGVVFAMMYASEVFVGATPERLVRSSNQQIQIDCLAGTTTRDQNPAQDEVLAQQLLASRKDQEEHNHVLRGILQDVNGCMSDISFPETPNIRKLANVQHLYTPITGRMIEGSSILDFVDRLHPTPAVAGLPKYTAMQEIRRQEDMDRGFYAGPIGFVDTHGDGAFNVALRCALVRENEAVLFAGAGIVADSNPLAEWTETEWKMQPMQMALRQE